MRLLQGFYLVLLLTGMQVVRAQEAREVRGLVEILDTHGAQAEVAANVTVTIVETQGSDVTNSSGFFRIPLPVAFRGGDRIAFQVDKPGYVIFEPAAGRERVPADLVRDQIRIRLLPRGSMLLLSVPAIQALIEEAAEASRKEARAELGRREFDLGRYVKDWALKYGFSAEQVKAEVDRWIAEIQENSDDIYELGLAAFAEKQFDRAGALFGEAAAQHEEAYRQTRTEREHLEAREADLREKIVRDRQLEGDAYANAGDYEQALAAYRRALEHLSRQDQPQAWADLQRDIGVTHIQRGLEVGRRGADAEGEAHVVDGIQALRAAIGVYAEIEQSYRDSLDASNTAAAGAVQEEEAGLSLLARRVFLGRARALTQSMLGISLHAQARLRGEGALPLLQEAVAAHRTAVDLLSLPERLGLPEGHRAHSVFAEEVAIARIGLAASLMAQATFSSPEEAPGLFREAADAYREVLHVYTREADRQEWGKVQHSLGQVLSEWAVRSGGDEAPPLLREAAVAFRRALEVQTREALPAEWGLIQHNLGHVSYELASRSEGEEAVRLLQESVQASQAALETRTRETVPKEWAQIQHNLGLALAALGLLSSGDVAAGLLGEAADAYRAALEVRSSEAMPHDWAWSQHGLGTVLLERALLRDRYGEAGLMLEEAADAYAQALRGFLLAATSGHAPAGDALGTVDGLRRILVIQGRYEAAAAFRIAASPSARAVDAWLAAEAAQVAALLVKGSPQESAAALDSLLLRVAAQPEDFTLQAALRGAARFIEQNEQLAPYQAWLASFFAALQREKRDAIVAGLQAARVRFMATYGRE